MPNEKLPPLTELDRFQTTLIASRSQLSANLITVRDQLTTISELPTTDLNLLEQATLAFITTELHRRGILAKVEVNNNKVTTLLDQIKFFSTDTSYLTGFLSTSFSTADEANWTAIESLLAEIYHSETGILKEVQDLFLFHLSKQQLATFLQKNSLQLILNKVIDQKNQLEAELGALKPNLTTSEQELVAQREEWEVLNERLTVQRDRYRREKESSEQQLKDLRDKYVEVSNKYTLMASREVILNAAKDELIIDKDREIKKCDDYRSRIEALSIRLDEEKSKNQNLLQLQIENHQNKSDNFELVIANKNLTESNHQVTQLAATLSAELEQEKHKFTELAQKTYRDKVKLMTVLAVDSLRNLLPAETFGINLHQGITTLETVLFASELSGQPNSLTWGSFGLFLLLLFCWGFYRLIRKIFVLYLLTYRKLFRNSSRVNSRKEVEQALTMKQPQVNKPVVGTPTANAQADLGSANKRKKLTISKQPAA